jgi:hypothetical protein
MKPPSFLAVSLMGNLVLAAIWVIVRQGATVGTDAPYSTTSPSAILQTAK